MSAHQPHERATYLTPVDASDRADAAPSQASHAAHVVDFAAWRVRLRGSATADGEPVPCRVRTVDSRGMIVDTQADVGGFAWLDVDLPDGSEVSALAEVLPRRDAVELAVEVRFKHLFPDHRARLLTALAAGA